MTELPDRFSSKFRVDDDGCWVWASAKGRKGYGLYWLDGVYRAAHRVAYEILVGPIPDRLTLDHLCRNTSCVNLSHLEPCTRGENVLRGTSFSANNARKTHCKRGHELSGSNVRVRVRKNGYKSRDCITCHRLTSKQYQKTLRDKGHDLVTHSDTQTD